MRRPTGCSTSNGEVYTLTGISGSGTAYTVLTAILEPDLHDRGHRPQPFEDDDDHGGGDRHRGDGGGDDLPDGDSGTGDGGLTAHPTPRDEGYTLVETLITVPGGLDRPGCRRFPVLPVFFRENNIVQNTYQSVDQLVLASEVSATFHPRSGVAVVGGQAPS